MKIAAAAPAIVLGDPRNNAEVLRETMHAAALRGAELLVLPPLALCGCTCGSLLEQELLREECDRAEGELIAFSGECPGMMTVLTVLRRDGDGANVYTADVLRDGALLSSSPMGREELLMCSLTDRDDEAYRERLCISLPRTPATVESPALLRAEAEALSEGGVAVVLTPGPGESGNDGVYTGGAAIACHGRALGICEGELLLCDTEDEPLPEPLDAAMPDLSNPFFPFGRANTAERCERILSLQERALAERMRRSGCNALVLGLSGGLDSTWALLVGAGALDRLGLPRERLLAVTMPGFGTIRRTRSNAEIMAEALGVRFREIPIGDAAERHLRDIGHDLSNRNATYENAQARERTQVLMDLSNDENALVLGTGDLSELALGWCTYNGDHMSMYGINAALPKTGVRACTRWYAENRAEGALKAALLDVLDTPVSPELLPAENDTITQSTETILGPYELHDFFLWHFLRGGEKPSKLYERSLRAFDGRYTPAELESTLRTFLRRFFTQQFKRSCLPDGPVLWEGISLSPRGAWRMPSDMGSAPWLRELDEYLAGK